MNRIITESTENGKNIPHGGSQLVFKIPTIDDIISACIEKIWTTYDEDNSGYLDRAEAKKFVIESMRDSDDLKKASSRSLTLASDDDEDEND